METLGRPCARNGLHMSTAVGKLGLRDITGRCAFPLQAVKTWRLQCFLNGGKPLRSLGMALGHRMGTEQRILNQQCGQNFLRSSFLNAC